jgi:2-keto-3-deoxy-galactonokinase
VYEVRILQLNSVFPKQDLASFLLGAILYEEFRCLMALAGNTPSHQQVLLSGLPQLQPAWTFALERHGFHVRQLNAEETERCFLTGMFRIFQQRPSRVA